MRSEHTVSKTKNDAAYEATELTSARARQEDARRIHDQKCNEAAVAETNYTNATRDVLGKAEALENHVKTVTMRKNSSDAERLLPKDPRAAQRGSEPLERAVSTAEYDDPSLSIDLSWKISASFQSQPFSFQCVSRMSDEYESKE